MNRELIIEPTPFGILAGLLEDGRLVDVSFADSEAASVRGEVFLGRIRAIDHDLDAAFVDCGLGQDAFLGARDATVLSGQPRGTPIGRQLSAGQAVIVQGRRDAEGGKGPRVTGDVALAGLHVIHQPRRSDVRVSERLGRSAAAEAARTRAARLFPDGGFVLRTFASAATDAELVEEALRLQHLWHEIEAKAKRARPPARLHGLRDPVHRVLAEHLRPDLERIVLADRAALARARSYLEEWRPALLERLVCSACAFEASGAGEQLQAALEPVVPLPGGGSLIIQPTAALTAIDVDGGGRRPLEANLKAAQEIARQVRLRRIGGTVVIDFVDLATKPDRARLFSALRAAFAVDPVPVHIFPMSPLGLVQMSRKRAGRSLAEELGRPCPACAGAGMLKSLRQRTIGLLAELERRSPGRIGARVAPDLHGYLTGSAAAVWATFGERRGAVPALAVDDSLAPGEYRIEETSG
jgi:ribonuclease G